MKENFKVTLQAPWGVSDEGLEIKGILYKWDEINDIKIFNNPNNGLTNGVFQAVVNGKLKNLAFAYKDKERANSAFAFIKAKMYESTQISRGIDTVRVSNFSINERFSDLIVFQENNKQELMAISTEVVPMNEKIYVALKGAFKEYLFCTDRTVYISKKGFMTGHTFGDSTFKMAYENITNAEVDYHLASGYFELSAGGLQNKPLNYWDNKGNSPQKAPNAISITGTDLRDDFVRATHFIMDKVAESKRAHTTPIIQQVTQERSVADQIRDLKSLVDEGLLTQEEFDAKKKQILGL